MTQDLSRPDLDVALQTIANPDPATAGSGGHRTAKRAIAILEATDPSFVAPTASQRNALLVAFARRRKVIYGAAFDIVRLTRKVDLDDPADLASNLDAIVLYEIKSTNRASIGEDLKGYFFALSTAELLVAQSLGEQYRFAFVNTVTGKYRDMKLREIFAQARGIYPTWSIRF